MCQSYDGLKTIKDRFCLRYNVRICKKCDVKMDIENPQTQRRGHEQKNMPTEYHCSKCDHLEYDDE